MGGPGGLAGNFFVFVIPYAYLAIVTLTRRIRIPAPYYLYIVLLWNFFFRLSYANEEPSLVLAALIAGMMNILGPFLLVNANLTLLWAFKLSKAADWTLGQLKHFAGEHPVAQVMLIGYSFTIMVEGTFSFGAAQQLAIPLLLSLGHSPFHTMVFQLVMASFASPFGAFSTHIYLGFSPLNLQLETLIAIVFQVAVALGIGQILVIPCALNLMVHGREIYESWAFISLSILSCVLPFIGIAYVRYEYSAVAGGMCSTIVTAVLAHYKIGLSRGYAPTKSSKSKARQNFYSSYKMYVQKQYGIQDDHFLHLLISRIITQAQRDVKNMDQNEVVNVFNPDSDNVTHDAIIKYFKKQGTEDQVQQLIHELNNTQNNKTELKFENGIIKVPRGHDRRLVGQLKNKQKIEADGQIKFCPCCGQETLQHQTNGWECSCDWCELNPNRKKQALRGILQNHHKVQMLNSIDQLESQIIQAHKQGDDTTKNNAIDKYMDIVHDGRDNTSNDKSFQQQPESQNNKTNQSQGLNLNTQQDRSVGPQQHRHLEQGQHDENTAKKAQKPNNFHSTFKEKVLLPFVFTFPFWGCVLVQFITQSPPFKLSKIFTETQPSFTISLGSLYDVNVSHSMVLTFSRIVNRDDVIFKIPLLGFPFVFPYYVVAIIYVVMLIQFRICSNYKEITLQPIIRAFLFVWKILPQIVPGVTNNRLVNVGGRTAPAYFVGFALGRAFHKGAVILPFTFGALISIGLPVLIINYLFVSVLFQTVAEAAGLKTLPFLASMGTGIAASYPMIYFNFFIGKLVSRSDVSEYVYWLKVLPYTIAILIIYFIIAILFQFV